MDMTSINLELNALIAFKEYLIEPDYTNVIGAVKLYNPETYKSLMIQFTSENTLLTKCLNHEYPLLDALGIDFLIELNGKRYALDVTKGIRATVKVKIKKQNAKADFYHAINAIPVILRSKSGYIPNKVLEFIEQSPKNGIVIDCRIGRNLELLKNN